MKSPHLLIGTVGALATIGSNVLAQDQPLDLGTLVLEGERIGRTLDETPPSTFVLSAEEIADPSNKDLQSAIGIRPNVVFEEGPYLPSVRGIDGTAGVEGSTSLTSGAQPRVPIILDGVALPTPQSATSATTGLWDVEAVEVARGPQATTSGRNAIGGAIRMFTNDPTFEREGALRFGAFNQDGTVTAAAMFNLPLVEDQVAFRFAIEGYDGESFVAAQSPNQVAFADEIETERLLNGRVKLLIEPEAVPGLSLVFGFDYQDLTTTFDPTSVDPSLDLVASFDKVPLLTERTIYSAKLRYDFSPNVELEQQFSFLDQNLQYPPSPINFDLDRDTEQFISDTVLKFSDVGIFDRGFFGVAYVRQEDSIVDNGANPSRVSGEIENVGIFGEVEMGLALATTLILGGRYEIDDRSRSVNFLGLGFAQSQDTSEEAFLPKIGIRHELNQLTRVGYTYSEGFRAGGIDFNLFSGPPFFIPGPPAATFDSERLKQHEVYIAVDALDGRWSYSSTAFYYTFENAQVLGADPAAPFLIGNVPEAEGYGLELAGSYKFENGTYVSGGLGMLSTEITDGGASGFGGSDLPRAPELTANLRLGHAFSNGLDIYTDVHYTGRQTYRLTSPALSELDEYVVVDLGLGYIRDLNDGRTIELNAYVNNLFDERYVTRDFDGPGGFINAVSVGRPRTVGASLTYRF